MRTSTTMASQLPQNKCTLILCIWRDMIPIYRAGHHVHRSPRFIAPLHKVTLKIQSDTRSAELQETHLKIPIANVCRPYQWDLEIDMVGQPTLDTHANSRRCINKWSVYAGFWVYGACYI